MNKIREMFKSIRIKLFFSLCIIVVLIVLFLITINNVVLESFYLYSKVEDAKKVYVKINEYYSMANDERTIEEQLNAIATKNDFDILIRSDDNLTLYSSEKNLTAAIDKINEMIISNKRINRNNEVRNMVIYKKDKVTIRKVIDLTNNLNYIFLNGELNNGNTIFIRIPISSIQESVRISNNLLILVGGISVVIAGILASILSRKFTEPITQLNEIATSMARLDFSKKYIEKDTNDEINNLGKSINIMSYKLETVINQLRQNNIELEKDIEEKSKIDEMRKQFISDVSHELKTPIALIQGYAEGLVENVNTDQESRKFYAEVILDEASKMDTLVKQLLELMKLEYGKREFNNVKFDIAELVNEVIRRCRVMLDEKNITVIFKQTEPVEVVADEFYIDQVVTNYLTNAIKHVDEVDGKKEIIVEIKKQKDEKIRISIFNTGNSIKTEDLERIWKRFYKVDESRNRDNGGTGIGLSLVKAIMNNYNEKYGVENKENGVEFYFELPKNS